MLHFFRKIRQRLLTENRFTKYLLYAIGEILLLVIGILIALQVNNWNEERRNEEKVRTILSDIKADLETDIKETTRLMRFYEKKDSTIFLYMTNELTAENFKNNSPENVFNVATFYTKAFLTAEGWTKLMDMSDVIPAEYKSVISKLNHLYNDRLGAVTGKNDIMGQITDEYYSDLTINHPWFTPRSNNDGSLEKEINYYLNSSKHRGRINLWYVQGIHNHLNYIISYRQAALEAHKEISELLNIPAIGDNILFNKELAQNLQGVWRSNRFSNREIILNYDAGRLFLEFNQDTVSREIFAISDNKLNLFPFLQYKDVEQENWQGNYSIPYYTILNRDGELILKDYFSEWRKIGE